MATGSCLTLSSFGNKKLKKKKKKKKNDHAQHNELRVSFVGQMDWNTEPVLFFFFGHFVFFSARPRRFGEKKVTRNIEKKAHGLSGVVVQTLNHLNYWTFRCMVFLGNI